MTGLGGRWGSARRWGTAWSEIHAEVQWQPWMGERLCSLPPSPPTAPSASSQPHLKITMRDSIYSTMSLCTRGPFPRHALERGAHAHTRTPTLRERERETRHARTVERIKMALSSICGMTSAGRWGLRGGSEGKRPGWGLRADIRRGCAGMRGRSNTEMVLKVGGRVEAGKPDKESGRTPAWIPLIVWMAMRQLKLKNRIKWCW